MRSFQPPLQAPEDFGELFTRTNLSIYRFIYGMLGSTAEEVEDLTCEVYMRAWKTRRNFFGDEHDALCWLFTIARNLIIDLHRKHKRHSAVWEISLDDTVLDDMTPSDETTPEDRCADREQFIRLWRSINSLSEEKREVLVLRYMLDWQVKDIASYIHKEENTTSVYIRRCLQEIRDNWQVE